MRNIKYLLWLSVFLPWSALAFQWLDLWQTPDQQGCKLLKAGKPQQAAQVFKDKNWQGVSHYRSGHYDLAFRQFNVSKTSDGQYNAGNAAAFMAQYEQAIAAYDKAIALNANNTDAITNREIVKKLLQQKQRNQCKKNSKQHSQKNKNNKQQQSKQNTGEQNQKNDKSQNPDKQKQDSANSRQNPANQKAASSKSQRQDENNKQLLRRVADDPGGLLQQKFLRDYVRRHQGAGNDFQ